MSWFKAARTMSETQVPPAGMLTATRPGTGVPTLPAPVPGRCMAPGCAQTSVYTCVYMDNRSMACGVQLCWEHAGRVDLLGSFCHRHAHVAGAVAEAAGSVFEHSKPNVDDRRYELLLLLTSSLDERVLSMLRQNFASVPAVEIKLDLTVRPTRRGGEVAWEKGWSVYTPAGSLARIALRIEEREPLHLQVFLNQRPLLDTVPDWFVQRPSPDRDYELSEAPLMPILIAIHNALSSDQPGF